MQYDPHLNLLKMGDSEGKTDLSISLARILTMHNGSQLGQKLDIESIAFDNKLRPMITDKVRRLTDVEAISNLIKKCRGEADIKHVDMGEWIQGPRFSDITVMKEYLYKEREKDRSFA